MVSFGLHSAHVAIASLVPCSFIVLVTPVTYLAQTSVTAGSITGLTIWKHLLNSIAMKQLQPIPDHLKVPLIISVILWLAVLVKVTTLSNRDLQYTRQPLQRIRFVKGLFVGLHDLLFMSLSSFYAFSVIVWFTSLYAADRELMEEWTLNMALSSMMWAASMVCKWYLEHYFGSVDASASKKVDAGSKLNAKLEKSATATAPSKEHIDRN